MPAALICCVVLRIKGLLPSSVAYSQNLLLSHSVLWGLSFDLQPAMDREGRGSAGGEGELVLASCLFNNPCFFCFLSPTLTSLWFQQHLPHPRGEGVSPGRSLTSGAGHRHCGDRHMNYLSPKLFWTEEEDRAMKTLLTSCLKNIWNSSIPTVWQNIFQ